MRSKGYEVSNDLFKDKSFYFRNALVRANYENQKLNVEKTQLPLEEFFKVLLFGYDLELKNRFLRIGQEYGTKTVSAIGKLHRNATTNDVVNDVVNTTEEKAIKAILRNSRVTASGLATILGVKPRQAQRILATLKTKAGLKRRGADKNGEWYFESARPSLPPALKSSNVLPSSTKSSGKREKPPVCTRRGRGNED